MPHLYRLTVLLAAKSHRRLQLAAEVAEEEALLRSFEYNHFGDGYLAKAGVAVDILRRSGRTRLPRDPTARLLRVATEVVATCRVKTVVDLAVMSAVEALDRPPRPEDMKSSVPGTSNVGSWSEPPELAYSCRLVMVSSERYADDARTASSYVLRVVPANTNPSVLRMKAALERIADSNYLMDQRRIAQDAIHHELRPGLIAAGVLR